MAESLITFDIIGITASFVCKLKMCLVNFVSVVKRTKINPKNVDIIEVRSATEVCNI